MKVVQQCSFHPESWMEQDLAPSSFLGGWEHDEDDGHEFDSSAHLLWIRYTLMMHHLSWYQTWVAMLIYHEFDASAHCFLLLGAFDDDAIDWLLLNESQLQAASMSQSTFKHTSAAAIFFPSAWRFIWVLCQTLPRASQPVGWLRGSVKGLMQAWEASACQRHSCWMHECGWDSSTFMRRPLDGTWRHERCQWKSSCWTLRLRSYLW